ncbi:2TM domain-containing protein [Streptomyces sp. NPDC050523]|uniref:2TM domain-containing protein n=1 Tax=Streptomyces sp. NPDC050523 TaxID=3365622 RepID=UPI0037AC7E8E
MSHISTSPEYHRAKSRVEKKRKYRGDLMAYVVINAFLVVVWAITGLGYFWPGWVLGVWGVFLILSAWDLYFRRDVTDEEVERELRKDR